MRGELFAIEMPLMVSLIAAFTSDMAFIPRLVTRRAITRKPPATAKMTGRKTISINDSRRSVRNNTTPKMIA